MTDAHCEMCDLPLATCIHGNPPDRLGGRRSDPDYDLVAIGPTINATQHSTCPGCRERIEPDDRITLSDEGWAHAEEVVPKVGSAPPATSVGTFWDGIE